ncbi:MAG: ectonucleotide pyrophosphatase/phosphodiesterase [Bradymonadia bacterium]
MSLRLAVWAMCLTACGGTRTKDAPSTSSTVVILSLDGFRYDYPEKTETPHIDRIAAEGVRVGRLVPPFPSQTFVGHATLATGVSPDRHGILNNKFKSRQRGPYMMADDVTWYDQVPLWIYAQSKGVRSHVYHWVGSAGSYHGVEPAFWRHFDKSITDDEKIDTIIGWLEGPEAARPGLVMSYLHGCDHAGHVHGPDSAEVTACVAEVDARLGRLMATIEGRSEPITLMVVSDHGMMKTRGIIDVAAHFKSAMGDAAEVIAVGPVAHVYLKRPEDLATAETAASGLEHVTVHRRGAVPKALRYDHPDRTGDLVLVAPFGHRFSHKPLPGHHGHHPDHPEMSAIFFAWGHGVARGAEVPLAKSLDLFPTACALMGLQPPAEVEGKVPEGMLELPAGISN